MVVLDRDGTVVIDRGYLGDPAGLEFEPGAAEGLRLLSVCGYRLIVITNQSGVGRGLFTLEQLHAMNARLNIMVESVGARLEGIYFCPHAPNADCGCRKPALGLLRRASSELGFDSASAIVVGDRETDIEFGHRAGATTVLICNDRSPENLSHPPDIMAANLLEAAKALASLRDRRD
jgi:D-glycero-D-manno-heptose 1,7-bisphosphate phosphatase